MGKRSEEMTNEVNLPSAVCEEIGNLVVNLPDDEYRNQPWHHLVIVTYNPTIAAWIAEGRRDRTSFDRTTAAASELTRQVTAQASGGSVH
jgi:hypothetical protein